MTDLTIIEISKEYLHFAAAHFTVFSATEREDLHGHNFHVQAHAHTRIKADGLAFDYNLMKTRLKALCDQLDEKTLLPEQSPYLKIQTENEYTVALFANERIPFLPRDVLTLPVRNITVEELARWLLKELMADQTLNALDISQVDLRVSSGAGQWACSTWREGKQLTG
ncbi:MAG: 6-carboxytetrahydropterin synthase [Proteobacteria bacterium]|nr:6-carboxytetrahydropterin synthase [Pseudomonadota bacterium]